MEEERIAVGIDVSKDRLDFAATDASVRGSEPNRTSGIAAIVATMHALQPDRIVIEATGGDERRIARALFEKGLPVCIVNARRIRSFARALGIVAKTDALDAEVLPSSQRWCVRRCGRSRPPTSRRWPISWLAGVSSSP